MPAVDTVLLPLCVGLTLLGIIATGLAAEDSIAPAAPTAPQRSISLRFKDKFSLRSLGPVVSAGRLIADNPGLKVAASIPPEARFVAMA